jgi:predicted secreted Zn-dependent protease
MPIRRTTKGWKIDNVPGYSKTKKEAEQRLKAVKASQSRRGRTK